MAKMINWRIEKAKLPQNERFWVKTSEVQSSLADVDFEGEIDLIFHRSKILFDAAFWPVDLRNSQVQVDRFYVCVGSVPTQTEVDKTRILSDFAQWVLETVELPLRSPERFNREFVVGNND